MSGEVVRQLFATIDARNWNELQRFLHTSIVYERPGYAPIIGLQSVRHFYENVRVVGMGEHLIEGVAVEGSRGACWGRFVGTKRDGLAIDERWADVYTFIEDKIATRRSHFFRPAI